MNRMTKKPRRSRYGFWLDGCHIQMSKPPPYDQKEIEAIREMLAFAKNAFKTKEKTHG
jgi:hypothetical protein